MSAQGQVKACEDTLQFLLTATILKLPRIELGCICGLEKVLRNLPNCNLLCQSRDAELQANNVEILMNKGVAKDTYAKRFIFIYGLYFSKGCR